MLELTEGWQEEYQWLCRQRAHFPPRADIWHLRFHWPAEQTAITTALQQQTYRLNPLERTTKGNGDVIHLRCSRDALVMKRLATRLQGCLPLSRRCTHVKGNGGLKAAVSEVQRQLPRYRYVIRTDIKGYYEHIDQMVLLQQLEGVIKDRFIMNLLVQAIRRTVHWGGLY
jgi:RNA-directed DNA polymerase